MRIIKSFNVTHVSIISLDIILFNYKLNIIDLLNVLLSIMNNIYYKHRNINKYIEYYDDYQYYK